ncbi:MAG: DUF5615 family PIN-like protein [Egibacteraceae bacterium]
MRFKLDENLGCRTAALFRQAGHDIATVFDEKLNGAADDEVLAACVAEGRILVTLDLDFANPVRFDPALTPGRRTGPRRWRRGPGAAPSP